MRSRKKKPVNIFLVNREFFLGVFLLLAILYASAGTGGFESTRAGSAGRSAAPGTAALTSQRSGGRSEKKTAEGDTIDGDSVQTVSYDVIMMRVTAYCWCWKCCGKHSDGITASGHRIGLGDTFVAADKKYSFGTEMIIPGYNNSQPVKVLDRGGAIRGNKLDVFFNSHQTALEWGVRYLPVKVFTR